jgi:hypothetical protein
MADIKISELPAATELDADDVLVGNEDGTSVKIPLTVLRTALLALGLGGIGPVRATTSSGDISAADIGGLLIVTGSSNLTINFPANDATIPVGSRFRVRQGGTAAVLLTFASPASVDDQQTGRTRTNHAGDEAIVTKVGSQDWSISYAMSGARAAILTSSNTAMNLSRSQNGNRVTRFTNGLAITATLQTLSAGGWELGDVVTIRQVGAGQVTVTPSATVTINIPTGASAKTRTQGSTIMLHCVDTASGGTWDITGDLAAA